MAPLFRNLTPFKGLAFESWGKQGEKWHTVVLKGTFALEADRPLRGMSVQEPITCASEYWAEPASSSMKRDNDLAPFKPSTDVHVVGMARAPQGRAQTMWRLVVRVGPLEKAVHVTGPRVWKRRLAGLWRLSEPQLVTEVPLRYELAFGGRFERGEKGEVFEANPVGRGFVARGRIVDRDEVEAPQFEAPDEPVEKIGRELRPEGFGPIAPVWIQRRAKGGTFDDEWLKKQWPLVPDDFDFGFYNSAHPDLVAPGFLAGDERVELEGFHAGGPIATQLPSIRPFLLARLERGEILPVQSNLDTILIDVDRDIVLLTWRARVPLQPSVRVIEARALLPEECRG